MRPILRRLNRLGGFTLATVLYGVAGLAFVPAVIYNAGIDVWGSVAFGQALGILGSVVIGYGWMVTGFNRVAKASDDQAAHEYLVSVLVRGLLAVPVLAVGVVLALLLLGDLYPTVAAASFVVTSIAGLSASWFFVGRAEPYRYLFLEVVPRVVGTGVAIVLLLVGVDVLFALVAQAVGILLGLTSASVSIVRARQTRQPIWRSVPGALRRQSNGLLTGAAGSLYVSLPVVLVGTFAVAALPLYSLVDKLLKQVMSGVAPLTQVAQGWVPRASSPTGVLHRAWRAVWVGVAGGVVFAAAFALLGPFVVYLLSVGEQTLTVTETILAGCLFGALLCERMTGRVALASVGREGALATTSLIGAAAGLAAVVPSAIVWGVPGAIAAVLGGMLVMILAQVIVLARTGQRALYQQPLLV